MDHAVYLTLLPCETHLGQPMHFKTPLFISFFTKVMALKKLSCFLLTLLIIGRSPTKIRSYRNGKGTVRETYKYLGPG